MWRFLQTLGKHLMLNWLKQLIDKIQHRREQKAQEYLEDLKWRYQIFRSLLYENTKAVELITDIDLKLRESDFFGPDLQNKIHELIEVTEELIEKLNQLDNDKHIKLFNIHKNVSQKINELLKKIPTHKDIPFCLTLDELMPQFAMFAGGKAANLAQLRAAGKFAVPDGFSILAHGCRFFLEESGLSLKIFKKLQPFLFQNKPITKELEDEIREDVLQAQCPKPLEEALYHMSSKFFEQGKGLAVRSSALSEDSRHHSFAGQFTSILNVRSFDKLKQAIKEVIASNFNSRSLAYRIGAGMKPLDFNMAVLCLEMIDAQKAGVLFTIDPNDPEEQTMLISAVFGMGELVVSGASTADIYKPYRIIQDNLYAEPPLISQKTKRLVLNPEGGLKEEDIPPESQNIPVLSDAEVKKLVATGLELEKKLDSPQDIEWAIDPDGKIWILQSRPLIMEPHLETATLKREHRTPIFSQGLVTSKGIATGKVKKIRRRQDLDNIPDEPVIIVMHRSLVDAAKVMQKVVGLLVDFGNPADHLSCVAREYGRPMLVGLVDAMSKLEEGEWITIDGEHGKVYKAENEEIENAIERFKKEKEYRKSKLDTQKQPTNTVLDQVKELTIKLNLTDAYGPTFSIMECRSLHDIVRYVHEKAVIAFFEAGDELLEEASGVVYKLESDVPFFLHIIDVGGGLAPQRKKKRSVTPDEVTCKPFKALWKGISTPGLRWSGPPPILGNMGAVMGRWMSDARSQRPLGLPNYIILARDYFNLNARMDFHFTMVDTVCSLDPRENYIKFRFKGGGTSMQQRHRRAIAIGEILERSDFFTDVKADLVNAIFEYAPEEVIEEKLVIVGQLLGFTRLIDAAMINDETPYLVADAFYEGDYELKKLVKYISEKLEKSESNPQA